jgi:hypothetical protein
MIKKKFTPLIILTLIALILGIVGQPFAAEPHQAYVEPGLPAFGVDQMDLIVTGANVDMAAQAVGAIGGEVTTSLWLIDAVAATIPSYQLNSLASMPGILSVVTDKGVGITGKGNDDPTGTGKGNSKKNGKNKPHSDAPVVAAGQTQADVQGTNKKDVYDLLDPVSVGIGANQVHDSIKGKGVTVAVLDTGIYFDKNVRYELGPKVNKLFIGQADFVTPICTGHGTQFDGHCFFDHDFSEDQYGHGTHVAGIIWNNYKDLTTGATLGIAPEANVLSVRVLDDQGNGSYSGVIAGIQYIVANQDLHNVQVLNISMSAVPTTPYFIDPLNRAVEAAWASGIVVVAAAGNTGPGAETITVPGNDPYVITVGAVNTNRTSLDYTDDVLPTWSAKGPTYDGFLKPDVLAPGSQIVSFMYNDLNDDSKDARLVQLHPDYTSTSSLFRMNGTSMATGVVSGLVALMLEANPHLTPDEVKYRLMATAQTLAGDISPLQQGAGRVMAPAAVFAELPAGQANSGMDIHADLAHGWGGYDANDNPVIDPNEIAYHYQGAIQKRLSDDGSTVLYFINLGNSIIALGATDAVTGEFLSQSQVEQRAANGSGNLIWSGGNLIWSGGELFDSSGNLIWSGGELFIVEGQLLDGAGNLIWSGSDLFDATGNLIWSGGNLIWSGGNLIWSGGNLIWSGSQLFDTAGNLIWSGGNLIWSGSQLFDTAGNLIWSGGELFDATGNLIWSGGNLIWSGGNLIWSGGNLIWSGGNLIWSGGNLIWSGGGLLDATGNLIWSGGNLIWSGGILIWSGGNLIWSGNTTASSIFASGANWVNDDGTVDGPLVVNTTPIEILAESVPIQPEIPVEITPQIIFIADLQDVAEPDKKSKWYGVVIATVYDNTDNPVDGAEVTFAWSADDKVGTTTCTTDPDGRCSASVHNKKNISLNTFEVTNIYHKNLTYEAAANTDLTGDTNGTLIVVVRP